MSNNYFSFKQFTIFQDKCAFKVGTDGVLLGACAEASGKKRILDIGTGTGLISLMIAQRCEAEIVAIEPDWNSFSQASDNIRQSKWAEKIRVENTSFQEFSNEGDKFDLIVANPPYFIGSLKNPDKDKSSARHNESLSHTDILKGAERLLAEDGTLQLILPNTEGNLFIAEAIELRFYCKRIIRIKPHPDAHVRRLIISLSRKKTIISEKFLTIETGKRHEYTEGFIALVNDYYLKY